MPPDEGNRGGGDFDLRDKEVIRFEINLIVDLWKLSKYMRYHARSILGKPPEKWQVLEEHLQNVAEKGAEFSHVCCGENWVENAGWLHDLGKADERFQGYLLRCNGLDDTGYDYGRVNHSSAGAACAEERIKSAGRVLAYLIAGHHAGLPDWEIGEAALNYRLGEGRENLQQVSAFAEEVMAKLRPAVRPPFVNKDNFHFWVRMLFSCLVDADSLDAEAFKEGEKAKQRGRYPSLASLSKLL
ncbi:MAG: CRISPR-associated endonuclease Cas3'', partial [Endomicrobiia bacterium]|nr:CRISPR-associated endonuclease Cas3'' [Endomicrobiia bacterium]